MLLHRVKPKIFLLNTATRNVSKPTNNDLAVINYQKEEQNINVIIDDKYINDNENISQISDVLIQGDEFMTRSMVRSFNPQWKPLNQAAIYSVVFYIDASNNAVPIYKYSNVYAFLPISSSLIYAATVFMQYNPAFTQGNIFSVTQNDIFSSTFQFNFSTRGVVGQGVDPPNNVVNLDINSNTNKIYAIARDASNNIYIGGSFFINDGTSNGIKGFAKWDVSGNKWSAVGNDVNGYFYLQTGGTVYSIVVINQNNIYVGGYFGYIDDNNPRTSPTSSFVRWNGSFWERELLTLTDSSGRPASVYAMKQDGIFLYIGGDIRNAKTSSSSIIQVSNVFRYNTNTISFERLGGGTLGPVYAMDVHPNTALYIGGAFSSVYTRFPQVSSNTIIVNRVVRWNFSNSTWTKIQYSSSPDISDRKVRNRINGNVGVPNPVYAIAVNPITRNIVWVGGIFQSTVGNNRTVSRASNFISSFDINRNNTTALWTRRDYGLVPSGA